MSLDLEAIKARCEAATPGPWRSMRDGNQYVGTRYLPVATCVGASRIEEIKRPWNPHAMIAFGLEGAAHEVARFLDADADFIAAARTDVPALVAEMERLTAELTKTRSIADRVVDETLHMNCTKRENAITTERDTARAESNGYAQQAGALRRERDEARACRDALADECAMLRQALGDAEAGRDNWRDACRKAEAERDANDSAAQRALVAAQAKVRAAALEEAAQAIVDTDIETVPDRYRPSQVCHDDATATLRNAVENVRALALAAPAKPKGGLEAIFGQVPDLASPCPANVDGGHRPWNNDGPCTFCKCGRELT